MHTGASNEQENCLASMLTTPAYKKHQSEATREKQLQLNANESSKEASPSNLKKLSFELRQTILQNIYPSQLIQVAQVSPYFYNVVASLPIWKTIAENANLAISELYHDRNAYYSLVESSNSQICEYLPNHLEPRYPGVDWEETRRYCRQLTRQKQSEVQSSGHAMRQAYISQAFAKAGLLYDKAHPDISFFIEHGGPQASWEGRVKQIISVQRAKQPASAQRRQEVEQCLEKFGLQMPSNSRLCNSYIENGGNTNVTIDRIVMTIREMDWYFRETNYVTLPCVKAEMGGDYYDDGYCAYDDVDYNKNTANEYWWNVHSEKMLLGVDTYRQPEQARALERYVDQRFSHGLWNDISTDADTPARPPPSLWNHIHKISATLWRKYANQFITKGVEEYRIANLLLRDPNDPDDFDDNLLTHILDLGAVTTLNDIQLKTSFSEAFYKVKGSKYYIAYLNMARKFVMKRTQNQYVATVLDNLPSGVSDFISRCAQTGPLLDLNEYRKMERSFIMTDLPFIAKQKKVHPGYLIYLFKKLKKCNRLPH